MVRNNFSAIYSVKLQNAVIESLLISARYEYYGETSSHRFPFEMNGGDYNLVAT